MGSPNKLSSSPKEHFLSQPVDDSILEALNPTPDTQYAGRIQSNDEKLLDGFADFVGVEWNVPHWEEKSSDDLEKMQLSHNYSIKLLNYFALRCQDKSASPEQCQLWADEFTRQSIEIYGCPDPDVARIIELGGGEEIQKRYSAVFEEVGRYLGEKYKDEFDILLQDISVEKIEPVLLADKFSRALDSLKQKDKRWNGWQVKIKPDAAILSCEASEKTIWVGEKRPAMTPQKMKALFAHEVLRHALAAVNGEDLGITTALPRYIEAEEGFAKVYELSIDGGSMSTTMNNYADMAFALGYFDLPGQEHYHSRSEVIQRKLDRETAKGHEITEKNVQTATRSANRIFRGTPGTDEIVGVFTKDVSYLNGFILAAEFIKQGLENGESIDSVMVHANMAKFDPTNPVHLNFIQSKLVDRYLPSFPPALPAPQELS